MSDNIDFYFDFASPYGYFASTRIDELARRNGRGVNWHPILLGPIFKVTGAAPLPLLPLKGDYSARDFERSARFHGIPFKRPSNFPLATQLAARAMLAVREMAGDDKAVAFARAVYRAYFVDGADISHAEAIAAVADSLGLDPAAVIDGATSEPIKQRLKQDVEAAMARGVFGAPFVIADGEPFWGFDRFEQLDAFLSESASGQSGMKQGFRTLVDQAMAEVRTYSVNEALAKLEDPKVQFVDVRDVRELEREGVIPGAYSAPRGMIEFWVDPASPYFKPVFGEDKEFVFFCAAGWRSALTTKTVQDMGLKNVAHIEGGFGAWKAAGAPVEEKAKKAQEKA